MAYVNPGFSEPDDAPPIPDDPEEIGALLSEVMDLADQEVEARLTPDVIEQKLKQMKRQVSYNQDVILCHHCKKRIRLNNNGHVRKHIKGKAGSPECEGSDALVSKDGSRVVTTGYEVSQLFSDSK